MPSLGRKGSSQASTQGLSEQGEEEKRFAEVRIISTVIVKENATRSEILINLKHNLGIVTLCLMLYFQLLRPIKDLATNWNVPLAEYLEKYSDELTELHIDIDGQTLKVSAV